MTIDDVRRQLEKIRKTAQRDNEQAHVLEDSLYIDTLSAIAERRVDDPAVLAAEALKAWDINYDRWYA